MRVVAECLLDPGTEFVNPLISRVIRFVRGIEEIIEEIHACVASRIKARTSRTGTTGVIRVRPARQQRGSSCGWSPPATIRQSGRPVLIVTQPNPTTGKRSGRVGFTGYAVTVTSTVVFFPP